MEVSMEIPPEIRDKTTIRCRGGRRRRGRPRMRWLDGITAQWTWVWVNSGRWWWTGRPGGLRFMGLQIVGHDWVTELNWTHGGDISLISGSDKSPGGGHATHIFICILLLPLMRMTKYIGVKLVSGRFHFPIWSPKFNHMGCCFLLPYDIRKISLSS